MKYLWIGLGGSLGALARYCVDVTIAGRLGTRFWYGTFVVNITACVIIGFSLTFLGQHTELNPAWRFLVPIGFVGAYSTFSTFEWEMFSSMQTGGFLVAGIYLVSSIILGLLAVWCGVLIARVIS